MGNEFADPGMVSAEDHLCRRYAFPMVRERELEYQAAFNAGPVRLGTGSITEAEPLVCG
jgi:hypothetical protein